MEEKKSNRLKNYFLSHQAFTTCIAIFFVLCGAYTLLFTLNNAIYIYKQLNLKTGIVSYWGRTGGKYNTATLEIENDSNIYRKDRVGGWVNLQHDGIKGEKVVFYIIKKQENLIKKKDSLHYFGLGNIDSPRYGFWIFMDVLCYSYSHVIVFLLLSFYGLLGFNWQFVKNRSIKYVSLILFSILMITFGLSVIS